MRTNCAHPCLCKQISGLLRQKLLLRMKDHWMMANKQLRAGLPRHLNRLWRHIESNGDRIHPLLRISHQ